MTSQTRTASSTAKHTDTGAAAANNPLAPTHSRPAHPHHKGPSRRILKKNQSQSRGGSQETRTRSTAESRRACSRSGPSASALLLPIGAVIALALVIRSTIR